VITLRRGRSGPADYTPVEPAGRRAQSTCGLPPGDARPKIATPSSTNR
jgi:hypothetical protein